MKPLPCTVGRGAAGAVSRWSASDRLVSNPKRSIGSKSRQRCDGTSSADTEVQGVDFFERPNHGLHQVRIEVVSVCLFVRALVQVGPHQVCGRDAQDSAVCGQEHGLVGVVEVRRVVEPLAQGFAQVAQARLGADASDLQVECWRQFKSDHLCQLNFDQGLKTGFVVPGCG